MPDFKVLPTVNGTNVSVEGHDHGGTTLDSLSDVTYDRGSPQNVRDRGAVLLWGVSGIQGPNGWYPGYSLRYTIQTITDSNTMLLMPVGEVDHMVNVQGIVVPSSGSPVGVNSTFVLLGNSLNLYDVGGETLQFRVVGDGSIELQRTAGTNTYPRVQLFFWFD